MICRQCGRYMPDNSRFCPGCGASVHVDAPATPAQPAPQTVSQPQQQMLPLDKIPDSPRLVALKKLARSPMMLIAALAFTASVVMSIWSSISVSGFMAEFLEMVMNTAADGANSIPFEMDANGYIISAIMGAIPGILTVIALWVTYFSAYKKKGMSTAGLTIVKVLQIIALVAVSLAAAGVMLVMGLTIAAGASEGASPALTGLIVTTSVIGVIFILVITYYARIIGSINAAAEVITNGRTPKRVSVYVAIVLIVGAVLSALSALPYLSMDAMKQQIVHALVSTGEVPAEVAQIFNTLNFTALVLPQLLGAVASFMFGILIFSYRTNVQDMIVAPPAPVYAHEVYRPSAPAVVPAPRVEEEKPAAEAAEEEKPAEAPVAEVPAAEEAPAEEAPASVEEPAPEAPAAEESPVAEEPVAETVSAE